MAKKSNKKTNKDNYDTYEISVSSGSCSGKKKGAKAKSVKVSLPKYVTIIIIIIIAAVAVYMYFNKTNSTPASPKPPVSNVPLFSGTSEASTDKLKIHFIDIGQGDCIFIQFPDGKNMLIDSGKKGVHTDGGKTNLNVIKDYLSGLNVSKITVALATHADEDHIGNLAELYSAYDIAFSMRPSAYYSGTAGTFPENFNPVPTVKKHKDQTSKTYFNYLTAVVGEQTDWTFFNYASDFSQDFTFNGGTYNYNVDFYTPLEEVGAIGYSDANDYSPLMMLTYGSFNMMFTGDAHSNVEKQFVAKLGSGNIALPDDNVEVLKVGHHGSESSSSASFLDALMPDNAVIMCGKGNTYKHPHQSTVEGLKRVGSLIYRTDMQGSIVLTVNADGTYAFTTEKTVGSVDELYTYPARN